LPVTPWRPAMPWLATCARVHTRHCLCDTLTRANRLTRFFLGPIAEINTHNYCVTLFLQREKEISLGSSQMLRVPSDRPIARRRSVCVQRGVTTDVACIMYGRSVWTRRGIHNTSVRFQTDSAVFRIVRRLGQCLVRSNVLAWSQGVAPSVE
jgi:hypothetical protein